MKRPILSLLSLLILPIAITAMETNQQSNTNNTQPTQKPAFRTVKRKYWVFEFVEQSDAKKAKTTHAN